MRLNVDFRIAQEELDRGFAVLAIPLGFVRQIPAKLDDQTPYD
jgi:hypothetical protein